MKIGQSPPDPRTAISQAAPPPPPPTPAKSGQAGAVATAAAQSTRSAGVAVTVSTLAQGLEKAGRGASADVDTGKVATVKAAIQDGTYVVSPEAIADKLLSNAQEMLQRTTR